MLSFLFFLTFQVILLGAWVAGYLDPYQKQLQEMLLDYMGETKVSYGLKSMLYKKENEKEKRSILIIFYFIESLTGKKLTEDQNLSKIQDQLGNQLGGIFGKGGLGEGFGSMLSKGL
jgi:hypothetical protein